jgi:hypothetical protein
LPVTTEDFVQYGMHRTSVAPAIREAEALGFIRITVHGRGGNTEHRVSNHFMLTFSHGGDCRVMPTHDWRRIKTMDEAKRIARAARAAKDPHAVAHGKRCWQTRKQNEKAGTEISSVLIQKTRIEKADTPVRETLATGLGEETVRLSIARVGRAQRRRI